ncbi:hypothetical protein ACLOJK_011875 [Asimina triloba]
MDSEDDMQDANDVESLDEFYSGETAMASDDGDGDYEFIDNDTDDSDDSALHRQQQSYTILSEADICQRQEDDITRISTVLSIPRVDASILLRHYNWSVSKVHDAWFADEEKVRKAVGLLEKPIVDPMPNAREVRYISTSINDGPGCLMLRCPDPSCGAAVGQDMINMLASDEDKEKYSRYLLRSYVEDNKTNFYYCDQLDLDDQRVNHRNGPQKLEMIGVHPSTTKWCPAPGCEYAVDFVMGSGSYDCTEEAHRPVDCGTVAMWILKNSADIDVRILANSKPCPKCKRPIEKNQGCMHITLCLGAWSDHGERTGGFYACNRYETAKQEGVYDETEKRREMAKNSLERYTHYYERWATNQSLM